MNDIDIKSRPLGYRLFREIALVLWGLNEEKANELFEKLDPYSLSYEDNWNNIKDASSRMGISPDKLGRGEAFFKIYVDKDTDKIKHTFYLDISTQQSRLKILKAKLNDKNENREAIKNEIEIEEKRLGLLNDTLRNIER